VSLVPPRIGLLLRVRLLAPAEAGKGDAHGDVLTAGPPVLRCRSRTHASTQSAYRRAGEHLPAADRRLGRGGGPVDEVLHSEGMQVLRTPPRSPCANAFAERWIGTARRACLDHLVIFGRLHLERVLDEFVEHNREARPSGR
jgi:hypothetical protein